MKYLKSMAIFILSVVILTGCFCKRVNDSKKDYYSLKITYDIAISEDANEEKVKKGISAFLSSKDYDKTIVNIENNKLIIEVMDTKAIDIIDVNNSLKELSNQEITIRDANDNLMATRDQLFKKEFATLYKEKNYYGEYIMLLNIKDSNLFYEITTILARNEERRLVIWLGFEEGVDNYQNPDSVGKIIYNATVSEGIDSESITIPLSSDKKYCESVIAILNIIDTYDIENEVIDYKVPH